MPENGADACGIAGTEMMLVAVVVVVDPTKEKRVCLSTSGSIVAVEKVRCISKLRWRCGWWMEIGVMPQGQV